MNPSRPLVWSIRQYQRYISPMFPPMCRFHPTCSQYAVEALQVHGVGRGSLLATWRLMRCHPFNPGGYDPVPPRAAVLETPDTAGPAAQTAAGPAAEHPASRHDGDERG